jgi:hypothetical protein
MTSLSNHTNLLEWAVSAAGRYYDEVVQSGGWLFRRREDVIDGPVPPDAAAVLGD